MMDRKTKYMPVWGRYVKIFDKLSPEELGELVHAMIHYHFDGTEPELSGVLAAYWDFLQPDLDYAQASYEKKVESGRKGGKRSGEVRRKKKEIEADGSEVKQNEQITRTESETISITESKSGTVSKTETESDGCSAPADAGLSLSKRAYGEYGWVKLTDRQYRQLQAKMGEEALQDCIRYIDRSAQSTDNRNRWKDWYLILTRCYEEGWYCPHQPSYQSKPPIPMGASGHLGEAELEAIRRVLSEEI